MIVARMTGGLGNQLFQYAMGRAFALRYGQPLLLDLSHYRDHGAGHTPREFELGAFRTEWREATAEVLRPFRKSRARRILERVGIRNSYRIVRQDGFGFSADVFQEEPPVYLDGTWQSERFFKGSSSELRAELTLKHPFDPGMAELTGRMRETASVSVHVRRGDYASDPKTRDHHGLLELPYFDAAIRNMLEHVPDAHFFVFSDEPDWAREHLRSTAPITVLDPRPAPEDLLLMAHCHHHIIANSSFSWWGAWLDPDPEKRVIAPGTWFNDRTIDTRDLLPDQWIRL